MAEEIKSISVDIDDGFEEKVVNTFEVLQFDPFKVVDISKIFDIPFEIKRVDMNVYTDYYPQWEREDFLYTTDGKIRRTLAEPLIKRKLTLMETAIEKVKFERLDTRILKSYYLPDVKHRFKQYKETRWTIMTMMDDIVFVEFKVVPNDILAYNEWNFDYRWYNYLTKWYNQQDHFEEAMRAIDYMSYTDINYKNTTLLTFEYTDYWFPFFIRQYVRPVLLNQEIAETTMQIRVPITCDWAKLINKKEWNKLMNEYIASFNGWSIRAEGDTFDAQHLLKCGDVELNPGPCTLSTMYRINNPQVRKAECQGFFNIPTYLEKVSSFLSEQLPALMDKFFFVTVETREQFHEDATTINDTMLSLGEKLKNIKAELVKCFILILIVFLLCLYEKYTSALVTSIIGVIGLFTDIPRRLVLWLRDYFFPYQDEDSAEVELSASSAMSLCGPAILAIMSFYAIDKLPRDSEIEQFSKKVFSIDKGVSGSLHIFEHFSKLWGFCQEWINDKIGYVDDSKITTFDQDVNKWHKDIAYWSVLKNKEEAKKNPDKALKISKLYIDGMQLKRTATMLNMDRRIHDLINSGLIAASKLYKFVEESNAIGGGTRFKPLGIALFGESQIGKTTLVETLAQDLLIHMGHTDVNTYRNEIYARQAETEFFDGYVNQSIIVVDDAFAVMDSTSKPNPEISETIRMINEFPHHLHMAILQDKNTFNTSKVVLWTINEINIQTPSLSYPEAFHNRLMENAYMVEPAPHCVKVVKDGNGKEKHLLDKNKLCLDDGPIDLSIYRITKYKRVLIDGGIQYLADGEPMDYETFAKHCTELYTNRLNTHANKTSFLNSRFEQKIKNPRRIETQIGNLRGVEQYRDAVGMDSYDMVQLERSRIIAENQRLLTTYKKWDFLLKIGSTILLCYSLYKMCSSFIRKSLREEVESIKNFDFTRAKEYADKIRADTKHSEIEKKFMIQHIKANMLPNMVTCLLSEFKFTACCYSMETLRLLIFCDLFNLTDDEFEALSEVYINQYKKYNHGKNEVEIVSSGSQPNQKLRKIFVECEKEEENDCEMIASGSQPNLKPRKIHVESPSAVVEACSDLTTLQEGRMIQEKNMYKCTLNGTHVLGNVIIIQGTVALMPYHYIAWLMARGCSIDDYLGLHAINVVCPSQSNQRCKINIATLFDSKFNLTNNVLRIKDKDNDIDAVLVYLDPRENVIHIHADIVDKLIKQDELSYVLNSANGILFGYTSDTKKLSKVEKFVQEMTPFDTPIQLTMEGNNYMNQRNGYSYSAATEKGDCGAALFILSPRNARKWIGIHVAGGENEGYSVKLTQEMITKHLEKLGEQRKFNNLRAVVQCLPIEDAQVPDGDFVVVGVTNVPLSSASRTKIEPSLIHGLFTEPITKPAYLRPFQKGDEIIDPAYLGLAKAGGEQVLVNKNILNIAINDVKQIMINQYNNSICVDKYARVMTYEEAIKGADDVFMHAVCRTTSPGYPWNSDPALRSNLPGKSAWMGSNDDFDFTSVKAIELRNAVEELEQLCLKGIVDKVICADTMKDERRPIEKVNQGKTRMFAACPQHFVVLFRKYFIGFSAWTMHNRISNEVAVGTNPYDYDWTRIAKKLQMKGQNVIAGDFSNFDGSLNSCVLWSVLDVIENWYEIYDTDYKIEHAKIRQTLWAHVVNSTHIYKNTIYQWTHSQPSGNPFTVIINSIYNSVILRCAYLTIIYDQINKGKLTSEWFSMQKFNEHVSVVTYGDDNCLNISAEAITFFNQLTLSEALLKWGHTYTDETKTNKSSLSRHLNEINFLKRKFVYNNDLCKYMAPLEEAVIWEMLNWKRINEMSKKESLRVNIQTALREIVLHGKEKYNNFVKTVCYSREVRKLKLNMQVPSYAEQVLIVEELDYFLE